MTIAKKTIKRFVNTNTLDTGSLKTYVRKEKIKVVSKPASKTEPDKSRRFMRVSNPQAPLAVKLKIQIKESAGTRKKLMRLFSSPIKSPRTRKTKFTNREARITIKSVATILLLYLA